ncbi:hypothetical protein [Enhygromyxa salina]|uniref:Uncharacterized protein n=1 Tax=Enhygromyxa salina TaxID=215803 RepID=A0A2S9Y7Y2_9BACT|nr:hypothetical protein [Enhygromyxa salina]PRQ01126.1 hypothetical protein ENSA7_57310 [Enhygromyxa salina]
MDVPDPAADIDPRRLVGAWYVLVSNYGFWRGSTHPRIDYDLLTPGEDGRARLLESRRFRAPDLLGRARARLVVQACRAGRPGELFSRGTGLRWGSRHRSIVVLADSGYRWTVVWYTRSNFGASQGLSIHTRDPWISQALLDRILARVRAHPFSSVRCEGLVAPEQHWVPPEPYRLDSVSV